MQITEQNKQEAEKVLMFYVKYVDQTRINKHDNQPEINAINCAIQNRQSVLEALRKIRSNTMSARDMIIDNNITNLTSQIEYLKSKL